MLYLALQEAEGGETGMLHSSVCPSLHKVRVRPHLRLAWRRAQPRTDRTVGVTSGHDLLWLPVVTARPCLVDVGKGTSAHASDR